jgi:hypothetical protein
MGMEYGAICNECGHSFVVKDGGGFFFHLLRCDRCGRTKPISFDKLGELHGRYLKGFSAPYSMATREHDEELRAKTDGAPLARDDYQEAIEDTLKKHRCGGRFRFDAPPRCPKCRSTALGPGEDGDVVLYD